jgi:hypothetical protein
MLRALLRASCLAASLCGCTAILSGSSLAQTAQDRTWCLEDSSTPEQTIQGCTALIQSQKFRGAQLAELHFDRAVGYAKSHDSEHAIADLNEAVRLNPKNAQYATRRDRHVHGALMSESWTRYLKEIQDDQDYPNWSGPPLDARAAASRR